MRRMQSNVEAERLTKDLASLSHLNDDHLNDRFRNLSAWSRLSACDGRC
jgi:hypothetical protein